MMSRFHLLAALVGFAAAASAADKPVEELLSKMRKAYQSVEAVSIQLKSRVLYPQGEERHDVSVLYQKSNRLRLEFSFRGKTVHRVSDGQMVYTWAEDVKSGDRSAADVKKVDMDALGGDAPINLEAISFFDWKRQLSTEKGANMSKSDLKLANRESWHDREWIVLEETAHGQGVFARYFIDPKSFFIWRCDIQSLDRKTFFMQTEVANLQLNPPVPGSAFKPPAAKPGDLAVKPPVSR